MSSIPNAVIPHALAPVREEKKQGRIDRLARLAVMPPLIALGITAFAFSALRSLAGDLGRKIDGNAGSSATAGGSQSATGVPV